MTLICHCSQGISILRNLNARINDDTTLREQDVQECTRQVNEQLLKLLGNLVKVHMALDETDKARSEALSLTSRYPTNAEVHYLLAKAIYMGTSTADNQMNIDDDLARTIAGITRAKDLNLGQDGTVLDDALAARLSLLEKTVARRRRQVAAEHRSAMAQFARKAFSRALNDGDHNDDDGEQSDVLDVADDTQVPQQGTELDEGAVEEEEEDEEEDEEIRRAMELDALDQRLGRVPMFFRSSDEEPVFAPVDSGSATSAAT